MKTKTLIAALAVFIFCQCAQPVDNSSSSNNNKEAVPTTGLKIAYVDVDSLLSNYNFYLDLAEELMRKQENYSLVLAEDTKKLEADYEDFNKKVQNNVFSSRERAQSEQNRIQKKAQAIDEKTAQYSRELDLENATNSQKVSEAIDAFLKEYNKEHGYNMIITKAALLYSDEALDITADVIEGLNAAYEKAE